MARPKKNPADRKMETVRIPVTADQKRLIADAAAADDMDVAAWARALLIKAAERRAARGTNDGAGRKSDGGGDR